MGGEGRGGEGRGGEGRRGEVRGEEKERRQKRSMPFIMTTIISERLNLIIH